MNTQLIKKRDTITKNQYGFQGDSGSPLVYTDNTIIGILSFTTTECDESELPAVYTRVSFYLPFIKSAIQDELSDNMREATWSNGQPSNPSEGRYVESHFARKKFISKLDEAKELIARYIN